MADADCKTTLTRKWVKLVEYTKQKTAEVEDSDIAHSLVVRELERESEWRLPYRYQRTDDVGRWHDGGLPIGYYWRDATINRSASSASWSARIAPGSGLLPELQIYRIEVLVTTAEPEPAEPEPAEPELVATAPPIPNEPKTRHDRLYCLFAELDRKSKLKPDMQPAEVERLARIPFHTRWPNEEPLSSRNRRTTTRAFKRYLSTRK